MSGLEDNYGTGYDDRQYPFVVYNGDRTGGFVTYNKETAHFVFSFDLNNKHMRLESSYPEVAGFEPHGVSDLVTSALCLCKAPNNAYIQKWGSMRC